MTGTKQKHFANNHEKLHRELQRQIIEFNEDSDERLLKAQKEGEEKVEATQRKKRRHYSELQLRKAQLANVKDARVN